MPVREQVRQEERCEHIWGRDTLEITEEYLEGEVQVVRQELRRETRPWESSK